MLDAKILAAVFASLTAVATAMNGGGLNADMATNGVSVPDSGSNLQDLSDNPVEVLKRMFIERPEPTNEVRARLDVHDLEDERIKLREAQVEASNLTEISLGAKKMSSDEQVVFNDFRGRVRPGSTSSLEGTADSVSSSGVSVSGVITVSEKVNSSRIRIDEEDRARLVFSNVEGEITSGSASTEFRNGSRKLEVNSFSGELVIYPGNNSIVLDGKVDTLKAGQFSFGG